MTCQPLGSLESRLSAIEERLGVLHGKPSSKATDVQERLEQLKTLYESSTDAAFRESCAESDKLLEELDAGTALTHQTTVSSTPLYYRRQEVLSSADDLKKDLEYLSQMLTLLMVSQAPREEGQQPLREDEVTNAPIVNIPPVSREDEKRLDLLHANIAELQAKTVGLSNRVDALLKLYASLISTASEKLVLADEEISSRERKQ
jgi:hypothetical protein